MNKAEQQCGSQEQTQFEALIGLFKLKMRLKLNLRLGDQSVICVTAKLILKSTLSVVRSHYEIVFYQVTHVHPKSKLDIQNSLQTFIRNAMQLSRDTKFHNLCKQDISNIFF